MVTEADRLTATMKLKRFVAESRLPRRWVVAAVIASAMLAACGGSDNAVQDPPSSASSSGDGGPVVFVGDSITAHWNMPDVANPTISELVRDSVVVSYPGQTSVEIAAQFPQAVLFALHPSVVVIEAGTNDMIQSDNPNTNAISEMANLATYEGARVLIASIPSTSIPQYGVTAGDIALFNLDLRYLCQSYGYTCLDYQAALQLPDGSQNMADFEPDGIHPNAAGYTAMWAVLHPALSP
jgi:lysophospholipase L1-like esterase